MAWRAVPITLQANNILRKGCIKFTQKHTKFDLLVRHQGRNIELKVEIAI